MERMYHRDVFEEIDNPKTVMEKTKTIRTYCLTFYPSKAFESFSVWLIVPILVVLLSIPGALLQNWALPTPKASDVIASQFSETRVLSYLDVISLSIGTRALGTVKNVQTSAWLLKTINEIVLENSKNVTRVEVVTQPFDSPHSRNGLNILVRISDASSSPEKPSVMVNAHYDSAPLAPGATDAAVHCAIELELIRNVLSKDLPPLNPIIFFFNNGEELGLLGSVAFMRNETFWARNIARFVNVDTIGGSGKEIFYRANPGSIVNEYNVPYPHANVIGEEIMQFIPNDSDFSSFVNRTGRYSNPNFVLNGIDLALYRYGYHYHTLGDLPKTLSSGGVQHIGENILEMLNQWGYKPFATLSDLRYIYFDIAGFLFVKIPEFLSIMLQVALVILFVATPILYIIIDKILFEYLLTSSQSKSIQSEKSPRPSMMTLVFESSVMMMMYLTGYILSIILCFGFGIGVGLVTGWVTPMSWYSSTPFGIFLFGFPCLLGLVIGQVLIYHFTTLICIKRYSIKKVHKLFQKERFLSIFCVSMVPVAVSMFFRVRASYLLTIQGFFLWFAIVICLVTDLLCTFFSKRMDVKESTESFSLMDFGDGRIREEDEERSKLEYYKENLWKPEETNKWKGFLEFLARNIWFIVPFFNIIPSMLLLDAFFTLLSILLPTAGRMTANSDVIFAVFVALMVSFVFTIFLPLVHRGANFAKIIIILLIGCVVMIVGSWFMFPYTSESQKRYVFTHNISATFDIEGTSVIARDQAVSIRANVMDSIPADYAINNFKGINDTRCEKLYCTFNAPLNVKPFSVAVNPPLNGSVGVFDVTFEFEASHRVFVNFTGSFTNLVSQGDFEGNNVFSKKGFQSENWKFTLQVPTGSIANVKFISYYMDLKYTPYLNETMNAVPWLTVTGSANFLTQQVEVNIKG